MPKTLPQIAASCAGRPILVRAEALQPWLAQLRLTEAPSRRFSLAGLQRLVGLGRGPALAWDDDDAPAAPVDVGTALAVAPTWLGPWDSVGYGWSLYGDVAVITIQDFLLDEGGETMCGFLHGYDTLRLAISQIAADERVTRVFLRINSPGGVAAGEIEALGADIRALRETKPVHVHVASLCCSAAYWIGAQGSRLSASPLAEVGSIGVVIVHENWSEAYARFGLQITPITFGAQKAAGADWEPLSPEARDDLQSGVDQLGETFVAAVVAGRPNLSPDAVRAFEARTYLARHADPDRSALALGLIDAVASETEAWAALAALAPAPATGRGPLEPAEEETPAMARSNKPALITALAAIEDEDKLARIRQILDEQPADDEEAADEDAPAASEEEDKPMAAAGGATALASAVMALPEYAGRETVAMALVATPGMTVDRAKAVLAVTPKASGGLAARMQGRDPAVSPAGAAASGGGEETADALAARLVATHARRITR
jgi:capsid assembly protease